jgi:ribulose-phosphate 3-epimerase
MKSQIKVFASILCADFTRLREEIKKCEDAGVDGIHVDVMDGHFVPVITIGDLMVQAIRPLTSLPIEAHLMVENPWAQIDHFCQAGADIISIHAECYGQRREGCREFGQYPKEVDTLDVNKARRDILRIKEQGKRAFMAINPGTPVCLDGLTKDLDGVLMMSVNPGFAKQQFNAIALPKITELRKHFKGDIAIDGGINAQTAPQAVKAGANILATASYFFAAANPKEVVRSLKSLA